MKILVPVACYHEYNTAVYVESALKELGHDARVITQAEYYEDHPDVDLFFCVDSAGPLNFPEKHRARSAMWFIDSRHNNDPERRKPDDDTNAKTLADGGGWVFQSQYRDWERMVSDISVFRANWLPLGADPDVWKPYDTPLLYDVGFGGNVWDGVRREVLAEIDKHFNLAHFTGRPEVLALGYSACEIGFNISSFYGSPVDYDVNMRVFEVMSCGRPLVTNYLPELQDLGLYEYVFTYRNRGEILPTIERALATPDSELERMGQAARQLIIDAHTYRHRMGEALDILIEGGMIGAENE
jgi:hypothetical protein